MFFILIDKFQINFYNYDGRILFNSCNVDQQLASQSVFNTLSIDHLTNTHFFFFRDLNYYSFGWMFLFLYECVIIDCSGSQYSGLFNLYCCCPAWSAFEINEYSFGIADEHQPLVGPYIVSGDLPIVPAGLPVFAEWKMNDWDGGRGIFE